MSDIFNQALAGKRGKHQQLIAEAVAREWGELLLRKNHDYGSAIFAPPVLAPDIPASLAIQVRLSDKLSRIKNLLDNPAEVNEESIDGSMLDYVAYRLLQRIAERLDTHTLSDMAGVWADDPPAEEVAEDAHREIVYIDSETYEIPDGRDIGKLAWVSDRSLDSACLNRACIGIADYRPDDESPYVSASGIAWKYAVLVPEG